MKSTIRGRDTAFQRSRQDGSHKGGNLGGAQAQAQRSASDAGGEQLCDREGSSSWKEKEGNQTTQKGARDLPSGLTARSVFAD